MATTPSQPNILLIMADQHRADCIGAYGNDTVKTPHLDALASAGTRYENCFCPFPVCTPSRYSLLSGRYVHEHRGWNNHCTPLPHIAMFPALLREAGYRTKAVGKMHFSPTYLDVGFDEMLLSEQDGEGRWDDDYHRYLMERGLVDVNDLEDQRREYRQNARQEYWSSFGAMASNLPEEHHSTTWIGDRAVETIEQWRDGGELLMASFIKPHHPFDPPASWAGMYDPDAMQPLPGWTDTCLERDLALNPGYFHHDSLDPQALRRVMAYYYATISQLDHHIGRMIDTLRKRGLLDNTVVVYTADHGDYMGFHHLLLKANYMYDPLMRIPLIIKWPEAREAQTASQLVSNLDVAPTLLELAGRERHPAMKGLSLHRDTAGRERVFAEDGRPWHTMVRTKTHKLVTNKPGEAPLLFDLEADPFEEHSLGETEEQAGIRKDLLEAAAGWRPKKLDHTPYLDEEAPVVDDDRPGQREALIAYYTRAMADHGVPSGPVS